ncbi:MerR family transcriptional regulator [Lentzea sp. NBRC 102530]|uniref:MerR family transcriptional regulator n=1 Tax=Lentzea sp. NBRC 102530 TaxID=3032201 RepID=UPI0024A3266B|nr:MerR family transcriptional regulator [Lentzea sp. NBRC 102530]GLY48712.1 MerR family transcriptional regulator [Lentzea sp. NBRC 102530]
MRIGELAERTGVSVRALRYYEEQGLLGSERTGSGQRQYGEPAVDRVRLIQQLYGAGMSSASILELLPCVVTGIATPEMLERMREHRASVVRQIAELQDTLLRFDAVMANAVTSHDTGVSCHMANGQDTPGDQIVAVSMTNR